MHLSREFFAELEHQGPGWVGDLAPIEGDFGAGTQPLVVFLSGDPAYMRRFAHALMNSIRCNGGLDCRFHLHIIAPDATVRQEMDEVARKLHVEFALTWENPVLPAGNEKTYYACARFLRMPALMDAYDRPVLLLDLDLLVIASLEKLCAAAQDRDLALLRWKSSGSDPWDTFWASAVWYEPTPAARRFAALTAFYIVGCLRRGQAQWYLDQCAIFSVLAVLQSRGEAPSLAPFEPAWVLLAEANRDPGPEVLFWSVIYSLQSNHAALDLPLFRRYAAAPGAG